MVRTSRAARTRARRMRRRLLVGCSLLLAFLVVATTAGYGYVHYRFGQIRSVKVPGLHKASSCRPVNLLVVGCESSRRAPPRPPRWGWGRPPEKPRPPPPAAATATSAASATTPPW